MKRCTLLSSRRFCVLVSLSVACLLVFLWYLLVLEEEKDETVPLEGDYEPWLQPLVLDALTGDGGSLDDGIGFDEEEMVGWAVGDRMNQTAWNEFSVHVLRCFYLRPPPMETGVEVVPKALDDVLDPSANGQGRFIARIFGNKVNGTFLEAGGHNGLYLSNTYFLEKALGWCGLMVEPSRENFQRLASSGRNVWTSDACVGDKPWPYVAPFSSHQGPSQMWQGAFSGLPKYVLQNTGSLGPESDRIEHPATCFPLHAFLEATAFSRNLDFLSLDLQGAEFAVLNAMDWSRVQVKVVMVELQSVENVSFMPRLLFSKGYLFLHRISDDFIYVRRDLAEEFRIKADPWIQLQGEDVYENFRQFWRFRSVLNSRLAAWILYCHSNRWFQSRMEFLATVTIVITALVVVLTREYSTPSMAGVALVSVFQACSFLPFVLRMKSEGTARMSSCERILEYIRRLPKEGELVKQEQVPPKSWPEKGSITFNHVYARYRPNVPRVLRNVSFRIEGGERVGIIGRTGAGKTTLFAVLLRLLEPEEGTIEIDGRDVTRMGLRDLRSVIALIPQDPTLFEGTIRYNVDPFGDFSDTEIWSALEQSHLKALISSDARGLEAAVALGGSNYSAGERQLLCLTRALLRKAKIIILDEATANVDVATDVLIQETIQKSFGSCTVLTIAHRLNSVLSYSRILVMDNGQAREFDTPSALMENPHSLFHSMMVAAGINLAQRMGQDYNGEGPVGLASRSGRVAEGERESGKRERAKTPPHPISDSPQCPLLLELAMTRGLNVAFMWAWRGEWEHCLGRYGTCDRQRLGCFSGGGMEENGILKLPYKWIPGLVRLTGRLSE
ncbi:unnamed protein product [Cyprideis torosa]|uniref:Uncharacterized protein n=1 Tax=Cyprideis torosa TaxID=163714 RepID=A0A7R8ZRL6_9CRUS|nr:unnamed protein product [Cyprideis torosa]CAG0893468.1 unnamed protein product [Cyprideis torosa]